MKKTYKKPLTVEELMVMPESDIDTSDIPELDDKFWENARIVLPKNKQAVSLRVSPEVLDFFKEENPKGYTSKMAAVLSAYVNAQRATH